MKKLNVAIVGLNFGALFVPGYKFHPAVGEITICDFNREIVKTVGDRLDIKKRCYSLEDVINDPDIDAVHLLTNIPDHAKQSVEVLQAGKHCACAVPMSITHEGIRDVMAVQKASGKKYMLMETIIFTRAYLYAQNMIDTGEMGNIQYIKGAHYQDMEGWPSYWKGMPPMYYASHALAPAFTALKCRAKRVICFGSGKMREALHQPYGNPYPMQTALYEMEDGTLAEITRTLFANSRGYTESFAIGGDNATFETGQQDTDIPVVFKYTDNGQFDPDQVHTAGREISEERIDPPDRLDLLPEALRKFTRPADMTSLTDPGDMYVYKSATGGYHPHVVNEFIRYIVDDVKPVFGIDFSADLTAACLCAHESAINGGTEVIIPKY
jgi:predicted dehydrogenase